MVQRHKKGFGFIASDRGGKDIFVHASALERAGIAGLTEGQRVTVDVIDGRNGPEAAGLRLIRPLRDARTGQCDRNLAGRVEGGKRADEEIAEGGPGVRAATLPPAHDVITLGE